MTFSKLNYNNARSEEQEKRMQLAEEKRVCPFCPNGLKIIHQKEIIHQNSSWYFTESAFPYEGTEHHYLINPIRHITKVNEITKNEWMDFGEIFNYAITNRQVAGGGIFLRFGEMEKTGSSVEHLHFQLVSGDSSELEKEESRESIKIKLGYKKK
jgi:diadenosine tetraphosphate (Ap4A) HIT family hydrolase